MRVGTSGFGIERSNNGLVAFNLGSDFVSEHEWGIKGLRRYFGIDVTLLGIDGCKINQFPEDSLYYLKRDGEAALMFIRTYRPDLIVDWGTVEHNLPYYRISDGGVGAWSESDFGIRVMGEKNVRALKELYEAFEKKDVAFFFGGGGLFNNAGLVVAISSRLSYDVKKRLYDSSIDARERSKIKDEIEAKIEAAWAKNNPKKYGVDSNKPWYSLGPGSQTAEECRKTGRYWLNPTNQDIFASGYFTEEELIAWTREEGPVLERRKEERKKYGY